MSSNNTGRGSSNKWTMHMDSVKVDLRRAIVGGAIAFLVLFAGGWLVGVASGSEAFQLFKTMLPRTIKFCGTIALALGNILALMLTLLSLSASMEVDIKWAHYQRVRQIAWTVTVTLIFTILVYLLTNIPVTQSNAADQDWYIYIYYALLGSDAILGGSFITIALLLYNTVRDMINVMDPEDTHGLRHKEEED